MKEQIIYYDTLRGCYCVTSRENYEERITNARAVIQCSDFASAEQTRLIMSFSGILPKSITREILRFP